MSFSQSSAMKQMAIDADTQTLPLDIIRNILKRIPVKSLIRFQCVCKHWRNLIKTPSFIADHLHHTSYQCPSLLFPRRSGHPLELCLLDREMQVREVQEAPLIDSLDCASIVGSSNGLLCVKIGKISPPSLFLWNPAIRELRQLPRALGDYEGRFVIGFGFSPIINDYKIVIICLPKHNFMDIQVEVYSLSSGSWKEVECGMLEGISLRHETVTANGAMFWIGSKYVINEYQDNYYDNMIVSFDLAMEVFTLIPMPAVESISCSCLVVYENKLAVLSKATIENSTYKFIDLWVMEEDVGSYGERWSWTKKYTSNPFSCSLDPVTIWKNEIVCNVSGRVGETEHGGVNGKPTIALFNLTASGFKMVIVHDCYFGINYVESFVPVGGKKSAMFM